MKRRAVAVLTAGLMLLSIPGSALAVTLDQHNTSQDLSVEDSGIQAQTFTAGMYGPLQLVTLRLASNGTTSTVSLQGTTGNPPIPDGNILATSTRGVNTSGFIASVPFTFTNNPIVIPGHVYALVIFASDLATVVGSIADYPRGRALTLHNLVWTPLRDVYTNGPTDIDFETYMGVASPTPTPTPAPTARPAASRTATIQPSLIAAASAAASDAGPSGISATESAVASDVVAVGLSTSTPSSPASRADAPGVAGNTGGSTDMTIPIIIGLLLVLVAVGGGLGFWMVRRRRSGAYRAVSGR